MTILESPLVFGTRGGSSPCSCWYIAGALLAVFAFVLVCCITCVLSFLVCLCCILCVMSVDILANVDVSVRVYVVGKVICINLLLLILFLLALALALVLFFILVRE